MITTIVSGGQSGSDQAGWRAAKRFQVPTSGWMPRGFLTEDGKRPEFAELYGAREHASPQYPDRTAANVAASHVLLWFGEPWSPGGRLTLRLWRETRPPGLLFEGVIKPFIDPLPAMSAELIRAASGMLGHDVAVMCAGNRESSAPGIGAWTENYLCELFRGLGFSEGGPTGA